MKALTGAGIVFLLVGTVFLVIGIVIAVVSASRKAHRTVLARGAILNMNASHDDMYDEGLSLYTPTVQFVDLHGYQHVAKLTVATTRYYEVHAPLDLAYDPYNPTKNLAIVGDDRRILRTAVVFMILAGVFVAFALFFFFGLSDVPQRV